MKNLISTLFLAGSLVVGCGEEPMEEKSVKEKNPTEIDEKKLSLYDMGILAGTLGEMYLEKINGKYLDVGFGKKDSSQKNVDVYIEYDENHIERCQKIGEFPFVVGNKPYVFGGYDTWIKFCDFDNDAKMDVAVGGVTSQEKESFSFYAIYNLGLGKFSEPSKIGSVPLPQGSEIVAVISDDDKNSFKDVGCRTFDNKNPNHAINYDFFNQGDRTFKKEKTYETDLK